MYDPILTYMVVAIAIGFSGGLVGAVINIIVKIIKRKRA